MCYAHVISCTCTCVRCVLREEKREGGREGGRGGRVICDNVPCKHVVVVCDTGTMYITGFPMTCDLSVTKVTLSVCSAN